MPDGVAQAKRALRAELRERRALLAPAARDAAARGIRQQLDLLVERHRARAVSCYLSTPAEPATREFIADAVARGIRVLLPITRADGLLDWAVARSDEPAQAAGHPITGVVGLEEPSGEVLGPMAVDEVDLMIIPAAAVDRTGLRLGWGRGYFDKTLGSMGRCPPVYAVVYDSELVDAVPREVHDQPVTGIVTPTRIVDLLPTRATPRER